MSGRAAILSLAVLFTGQAVLASLSGAEEGKMEDRVTRIEAEGLVRMVQDGRRAVADRAVYERAEEKVVLTGSPKVWEDKNVVSGREITVFLDEDRHPIALLANYALHYVGPTSEGDLTISADSFGAFDRAIQRMAGRQFVGIMSGGHHFMETPIGDQVTVWALPAE